MFSKFTILTDACEICVSEYIKKESEERLKDLPHDQHYAEESHRIIHGANKASTKLCVRYPCREQMFDNFAYHNICVEHLYKMIDAIKEREEFGEE